jgi:hypothetical protein
MIRQATPIFSCKPATTPQKWGRISSPQKRTLAPLHARANRCYYQKERVELSFLFNSLLFNNRLWSCHLSTLVEGVYSFPDAVVNDDQ